MEADRCGVFPIERLWNLGSVLFKSDSIIRGNTPLGLNLLEAAGFSVRTGREARFSRALVRAFWKFSLGRLSPERIVLLARLLEAAPALYLLVEAKKVDPRCPTALRLTELKGEVAPAMRRPEHLRRALGPPQCPMMNFVHTGDEPADVVRELGLLFDEQARWRLLSETVEGRAVQTLDLADRLVREGPAHDLDFHAAVDRVARKIRETRSLRPRRALLRELLGRMEAGSSDAWREVRRILEASGASVSPLDEIVLEARDVRLKRDRPTQPFPSCERRHWVAAGVMGPLG